MNKYLRVIPVVSTLLLPLTSFANTSYLTAEHHYRMNNRFHSNRLGYVYKFDKGLKFDLGVNLVNRVRDDVDDITSASEYFEVGYDYRINDHWSIMPSLRFKLYTGVGDDEDFNGEIGDNGAAGARYIPGLKIKYHLNDDILLFTKYQYEKRTFSYKKYNEKDDNTYRDIFQVGASYRINGELSVEYSAEYQDATYALYDNKQSNYEQGAFVYYRPTHDFQPFLGIEDTAVATDSDTREATVTVGLNYYF